MTDTLTLQAAPENSPTKQVVPEDSLTKQAARGVAWSGISQVTDRVARLASTTVLAALLQPSDFGLVGVVASVTAFVNIFQNAGTGAAVVQRRDLNPQLINSVFCFNALTGVLGCVGMLVLARPLASFFDAPVLAVLFAVSSMTFIFTSLVIVPNSLLTRRMRFRELGIIDSAGAVFLCVVGIAMALTGFGVWSLVVPGVLRAAILPLFKMRAAHYYGSLKFRFQDFKSIFGFSGFLTANSLLRFFSRNSDMLLVAKLLSMKAAGFYGLAYGLMLLPMQACVDVIKKVMFPAFAKIQDDNPRFRAGYLKSLRMICFLAFPAILGQAVVVKDAVLLIYGPEWEPAAMLFWFLIPVGLADTLTSTVSVIYQSKGRTGLFFGWSLVSLFVTIPSLLFGLQYDISGMALAYSFSATFLLLPGLIIPSRLIELRTSQIFINVLPSFLCSLAMAGLCMAISMLIDPSAHFLRLVTQILVGITGYAAVSMTFNRSCVDEVLGFAQGAVRKKTALVKPATSSS